MTGDPRFDVFLDVSALDVATAADHVRRARAVDGFGLVCGRLGAALPQAAADGGPTECLQRALRAAAWHRRALLVVVGPVLPGSEMVPGLLDVLDGDCLVGSAQPLFAEAATDRVWPIQVAGADERPFARAGLLDLPDRVLTAELPSVCVLLRRELVAAAAADGSAPEFRSVTGALAYLTCRARRRGFRNVCATRLVLSTGLQGPAHYERPDPADERRILDTYPDHGRALAANDQLAERRIAPLLDAAHPPCGTPRRLLLDCRGLVGMHNGTSRSMLGQLSALAAGDDRWEMHVLATAEAARYHQLADRFPRARHVVEPDRAGYAAAFRMNQPWDVGTIAGLHRCALTIGFNMLDTISWDVLYSSPEGLGRTWSLMAGHADVLTFISGFSRDRFHYRFPRAADALDAVAHLSFDADEQTLPACRGIATAAHVLVFGNAYDHKDIAPTLDILLRAFPFQDIVVIGETRLSSPRLRSLPSGQADEAEIHALVASARAIVYPSYYEGFGLPVVEGLAYGRPVLVRASPMWREVADNTRLPGALVAFEDEVDLVEHLGRVLAGLPVAALPGAEPPPGWRPATWASSAGIVLDLLERSLPGAARRWLARDRILQCASG